MVSGVNGKGGYNGGGKVIASSAGIVPGAQVNKTLKKYIADIERLFYPPLGKAIGLVMKKHISSNLCRNLKIGFDISMIARINRCLGSQNVEIVSSDDLAALNKQLDRYGYRFGINESSEETSPYVLYVDESNDNLPELERFRRDPGSSGTAIKLSEMGDKEKKEVERIFLYEMENPGGSNSVIDAAMEYFYEIKDWPNCVKYLEFDLQGTDFKTYSASAKKESCENIYILAVIYYKEMNDAQKAKELLDRYIYGKPQRNMPEVPDDNLAKVVKLYEAICLSLKDSGALYMLHRYLRKRFTAQSDYYYTHHQELWVTAYSSTMFEFFPSKSEAENLIGEKINYYSIPADLVCEEEIRTFSKYNLMFLFLIAGDIKSARKYFLECHCREIGNNAYFYYALEAILLEKEGKIDEAFSAALKAQSHEPRDYFEIIQVNGLKKEVSRIIQSYSPKAPVIETALTAKKSSRRSIDEIIFRDDWRHYYKIFPKQQAAHLGGKISEIVFNRRSLIENMQNAKAAVGIETEVFLPQGLMAIAQELGIGKICASAGEDGIKVRIFGIKEEDRFEGTIDETLSLQINSRKQLRLAKTFLEAAILEDLVRRYYNNNDPSDLAMIWQ